jgi:lipopolysaccharide/colanic/teichoic acid biosynthesis glycosyltransferase
MTAREVVAAEPDGPDEATEESRESVLVARYRAMAHAFEPQPVDHLLRGLDVVVAAALLVITAPALAGCMLALLASGGRPIVYRGPRVGRDGRIFEMYKLRTLRHGAPERLGSLYGPELTRRTAEETTRVGHLLRLLKLDELPQLWNVLRGDMSMVGPRPIRPLFFEELCVTIPAYWQRLVVRPGLTGLAQLRLSRDMTWEEKLAHDFEYIADRSAGLYAAILVQTGALVMRRMPGRD